VVSIAGKIESLDSGNSAPPRLSIFYVNQLIPRIFLRFPDRPCRIIGDSLDPAPTIFDVLQFSLFKGAARGQDRAGACPILPAGSRP
jgi:hypothetical protein